MYKVNADIAERAQEIARANSISFGEALYQARREMADIVRTSNGSPLRDQESSATPPSSEVRTAVMAGLMAVAPTWKKNGEWIATSGAQALHQACASVSDKLDALGIGDQLVSGMCSDLFTYLQNAVGRAGTLSDLVTQAADHVASAYEQALINKVPAQSLSERQMTVARQVAQGTGSYVSLDSVDFRDRAMAISRSRGVSFGEALSLARHGVEFADDVIEPQKLDNALTPSLKSSFVTIFGGAQQKIIGAMDVLKIKEQIQKTLSDLGMGSATSAVTKAVESTLNAVSGVVQLSAVDGIIRKVVSAAQQAYKQAISNS
jgi:hypothetical protein